MIKQPPSVTMVDVGDETTYDWDHWPRVYNNVYEDGWVLFTFQIQPQISERFHSSFEDPPNDGQKHVEAHKTPPGYQWYHEY